MTIFKSWQYLFSLEEFVLFFFRLQGQALKKIHHIQKVVPVHRKVHVLKKHNIFSFWNNSKSKHNTHLKKSWVSRELSGGRDNGSEFSRPACRVFVRLSDSSCDTGDNKGRREMTKCKRKCLTTCTLRLTETLWGHNCAYHSHSVKWEESPPSYQKNNSPESRHSSLAAF